MVAPNRTIGFLIGHGEGTPEVALPYLTQVLQRERLRYLTRNVDLRGGELAVPDDIQGLVVMNPTRAITERELRQINAYLLRGGAVAIFAGGVNVTGDFARPAGARSEHGLNALLNGYGITVNPDVIIDQRATEAITRANDVSGRIRLLTFPMVYPDDLNPIHPTVFRLPMIVTPFVSSMTIDAARATENRTVLTTIGRTTAYSRAQQDPYELNVLTLYDAAMRAREAYYQRPGQGPHTVAVSLEGQLRSAFPASSPEGPVNIAEHATAERPARLLVVSSGKMFTTDEMRVYSGMQQGMPSNISMLLNTFDWLSQDPELLAIRARSPRRAP